MPDPIDETRFEVRKTRSAAESAAVAADNRLGFFEEHPESQTAGIIAICGYLDALRLELAELRLTIERRPT